MKLLTHLPSWLTNKYFVSFAAFCMVILFLDRNDIFTQLDRQKELRGLQQSKTYFTTEIASERKELEGLKNNPATIEKYAREKYMMKRDNEELFLVPENYDQPKN
jgi:cell division protein DivIC